MVSCKVSALLIANEPYNNHLLVLSAIKGGPADRAGITSGAGLQKRGTTTASAWSVDCMLAAQLHTAWLAAAAHAWFMSLLQ